MDHILCNLAGEFRYDTLNGRQHIVAPVTMIVPGVLHGSSGALFYSPDVVNRNPDAWNGMPIVVYHPTCNGEPISARQPDVLNKQGVGIILEAKGGDVLVAEAWFDVDAVKLVDNTLDDGIKIHPRLIAGIPIELSTGLKTRVSKAGEGAVYNSRPYDYAVEDIEPDHLAILPDQIGACSLEDGCGVFAANGDNKIADWQKALQKHLVAKGADDMDLKSVDNAASELSFDEIRDKLNEELRGRFTQDEPSAWISEVYGDHIIYWQGDDLFRLSYTLLADGVVLSSDAPVRVEREVTFVPVENEGDALMAMNAKEKKALIGKLIANSCGCWKKGDEALLEGFTDEKLTELIAANAQHQHQLTVVNALTKGIDLGGKVVAYDQKKKAIVVRTVNTDGDDDTVEGGDSDDSLDVADGDDETVSGSSGADTVTGNRKMSEKEYLRLMPDSVRRTFNNARRVENTEKAKIVKRLLSNVADESKRERLGKKYMTKDLVELQELLDMMPETVANEGGGGAMFFGFPVEQSFMGQQGAFATSNASDEEANDILELPSEDMLDN